MFYVRFLKNLIDKIEKIKNDIDGIYILLIKKEADTPDFANEEPIKVIKDSPIILSETNYPRTKLIIQNIGLEPCYIKLDSGVSIEDFHFVLAPDTSPSFGNGGSITLDNWHGGVWAICEKETKLSILEY